MREELSKILTLLLAIIVLLGTGNASAGDQVRRYDYTSYRDYYNAYYRNSRAKYSHRYARALTSLAVMRATTERSSSLISDRISKIRYRKARSSAQNGVNSKKTFTNYKLGNIDSHNVGFWTSSSWQEAFSGLSSNAFDGDMTTMMMGIDYEGKNNSLFGIAVGYESLDFDNKYYDNTVTGENGRLEGTGLTISPYMSFKLSRRWNLEMTGGYNKATYDSTRFDFSNGDKVLGSTEGTRKFFNAKLTTYRKLGKFNFWGDTSYFYANEIKDSFAESNGTIQAQSNGYFARYQLNGRLDYNARNITPYVTAGLDFRTSETYVGSQRVGTKDYAPVFGAGFSFHKNTQTSGRIDFSTKQWQKSKADSRIMARVRIRF